MFRQNQTRRTSSTGCYAGLWGFLMAPILAATLLPNAMLAAAAAIACAAALAHVWRSHSRGSANAWLMARVFGVGAIPLMVAMFAQELMHVERTMLL